ncbi:hypothetical protein TIFTF001_025049 [Ficus carica]|uniref:Transmembrane protein n=1 Tax=Ficus carica TaxID=3494 RepID=A0AA88DH46_FICCA|nr:hypothetical protein TIFTF001_025049 [Ficus carica]
MMAACGDPHRATGDQCCDCTTSFVHPHLSRHKTSNRFNEKTALRIPSLVSEFACLRCREELRRQTDRLIMGTREVYEEKLKRGNLHHDPTINPGLGCPRCPRCLSTLNPNSGKGEWAITSVLHDATAVAGSGIGGMLSAIYGLNTGIPYLQNRVKGPKWLPFIVGLPPLLMFSGASAAFGVLKQTRKGYVLPRFAQLTVTSYYAASSASHYGISLLTRHIEEAHTSRSQQEKLR